MRILKKGFTLAEMMVCLAVIMVIAAILLPSLWTHSPNKNKAMSKKTYKIIESSVYEMLNDSDNYPLDTAEREGLAVFNQVDGDCLEEMPEYYEGGIVPLCTERISGTNMVDNQANTGHKMCILFARQLNISGTPLCEDKGEDAEGKNYNPTAEITKFLNGEQFEPTFKTNDGADWLISQNIICDPENQEDIEAGCKLPDNDAEPDCTNGGNLSKEKKLPYSCIYVDVNGSQDGRDENDPNSITNQQKADRYGVALYYDGKIRILRDNGVFANSPAFKFVTSNSLF